MRSPLPERAVIERPASNPRFIFTGAPGGGKTTVLNELASRGLRVAPEAPRAIIRERRLAGLPPRPPPEAFAAEVLRRDVETYRTTPVDTEPVYFDRGLVDALASFLRRGAMSLDEIGAVIARHPFNRTVFVFAPWREIFHTDEERDESLGHSMHVHQDILAWYARWQFTLVEVPRVDVAARADFVVATTRRVLDGA